ncbi:hypothetical protein [Longimicrobium terrae]|uniref:Uncharacterized protein n=1 Tax=Longimicrobium terrae TaxID=1639882 RepID=A0A841GJ81_9BACT|nr:hypothetical protein [Longimicrobium terrae]MBB4634379.1 hypothetical protein [Longimicrobium terrae]MBB6068731.1 hypothetical protein [Longimicrobium terrae]NNC27917.1 hypothetical protein [Longimicrobium terrae]
MRDVLSSPWINIVAAVVGGMALGYGLGTLPGGIGVPGVVWTLFGLILLWWTLSDRRKARRGTSESEADGSHTIE